MIKLICNRCGQTWYTANTRPNQKCIECGGDLNEYDIINSEAINKEDTRDREDYDKKCESKIIRLK
jgi:predicted  nucleic acid-binding Zn-ribbon protein